MTDFAVSLPTHRRLKILFYLPAVTPWWFQELIAPLLRTLHGQAELHVMVAPVWRNTGLAAEHVEPLADLPEINWHIVMADQPEQFRFDGAAVDGLLDLVAAIDPDLTIARSADRITPNRFPGLVRYITEPGAEPFRAPHRWFVLDEQPFHHGVMPEQTGDAAERAAELLAPVCDSLDATFGNPDHATQRAMLGLPADRPVLAIPLQYEHPENLYSVGSPFQFGPELVRELLHQLDERIVLAITDHPLNAQYLIRFGLEQIANSFPDRVRLIPFLEGRASPTGMVLRAADAVLLDQSKCVWLAGYFGTPIVHIGDNMMADWMNATPLAALDAERMSNRGLPAPDRAMARRWFGWHYGTRLINPRATSLERLMAHVEGRVTAAETEDFLVTLEPWLKATRRAADTEMVELADRALQISRIAGGLRAA